MLAVQNQRKSSETLESHRLQPNQLRQTTPRSQLTAFLLSVFLLVAAPVAVSFCCCFCFLFFWANNLSTASKSIFSSSASSSSSSYWYSSSSSSISSRISLSVVALGVDETGCLGAPEGFGLAVVDLGASVDLGF